MKLAAVLGVVAAGFVLTLLQMLGDVSGNAILAGIAGGCLVLPLFRLFGYVWGRWWVPAVTAGLASCVGTATGSLGAPDLLSWRWLGPACAVCACLGITSFLRIQSRRCQLCRGGLRDVVAFDCPRCGLLVCENKCWRFDSCRCRLCADQGVPVFPADNSWWDEHFGPRASLAKCHLCLTAEATVDLRACPKCSWPQCRECWDFANGQCGHCGWILADLPPALKRYMFPEKRALELMTERQSPD
jgi:hypothetical protein